MWQKDVPDPTHSCAVLSPFHLQEPVQKHFPLCAWRLIRADTHHCCNVCGSIPRASRAPGRTSGKVATGDPKRSKRGQKGELQQFLGILGMLGMLGTGALRMLLHRDIVSGAANVL